MTKPATEHVLSRTGDLPLKLTGIQLSDTSTRVVNSKDRLRWHELDIYQASKFVAHVKWHTAWEGEQPHDTCLIADSLQNLASQIRDYDPLEYLIGFPEGQQFERKQERLEQSICDDWSAMISDVFMKLNITESL